MVIVDDATSRTYGALPPGGDHRGGDGRAGPVDWPPWRAAEPVRGPPQHLPGLRDAHGRRPPTQFGRAMKELQVELILAQSPQAKGRVERKHQVFQDRLVKELRLRGIRDIAQANVLLEEVMLPEFNRRYAVKPGRAADLHRPAPADLAEILCLREDRIVGQDWCVALAEPVAADPGQRGDRGPGGQESDGQGTRRRPAAGAAGNQAADPQGTALPAPASQTCKGYDAADQQPALEAGARSPVQPGRPGRKNFPGQKTLRPPPSRNVF